MPHYHCLPYYRLLSYFLLRYCVISSCAASSWKKSSSCASPVCYRSMADSFGAAPRNDPLLPPAPSAMRGDTNLIPKGIKSDTRVVTACQISTKFSKGASSPFRCVAAGLKIIWSHIFETFPLAILLEYTNKSAFTTRLTSRIVRKELTHSPHAYHTYGICLFIKVWLQGFQLICSCTVYANMTRLAIVH